MKKQYLMVGAGGLIAGAVVAFAQNSLSGREFRIPTPSFGNAGAVERCDELGGHPDDPEHVGAGVVDEQLDAAAVVKACEAAVRSSPDVPRLRFQLARGYLASNELDKALAELTPAAEAGHGGALAFLGDIYLAGADGIEPEPETGIALLEQAAEAGYEPARAVLAEFEEVPSPEEPAEELASLQAPLDQPPPAASPPASPPQAAKGADFSTYELPRFMNAIYSGKYDETGLNDIGKAAYIINMATAIRQTCRGPFTTDEISGWRTRYAAKAMDEAPAMVAQSFQALADMMQNPQAAVRKYSGAISMDEIPMMAQQDAMSLIQDHNCSGAVFSRFTGNMRDAIG